MFDISDFDYEYPAELIAQRPLPDRSASRLLVLDRATGAISHRYFHDFPDLVTPGDVLVVNASRVIPARLTATRDNGRPAEVLLVYEEEDGSWLTMVHPGGKLKVGRRVSLGDAAEIEIVAVLTGGLRRVRFHNIQAREAMARYGATPLPPYISRPADKEDHERYQTIFARDEGSVAAPTAGLHFTPEIVQSVRDRGAQVAEITLHVGPGTFKPVEVEDPAKHVMHAEWYEIPEATADAVNRARESGGRVWAIGTTAARTLEAAALRHPLPLSAATGWTDLFIYPPFQFRVVDTLLTNLHLPRSTLLMLVASFAGHEHTMAAYRAAVAERYRLYSYGDAMSVV